jgi:hypothetical protein
MTVTIKDSIVAAVEMCCILEFFCEYVTGIDNTWDMGNLCDTQVLCFMHIILVEVKMFGAFIPSGGRQVNTGLIVIIDGDRVVYILQTEVTGTV